MKIRASFVTIYFAMTVEGHHRKLVVDFVAQPFKAIELRLAEFVQAMQANGDCSGVMPLLSGGAYLYGSARLDVAAGLDKIMISDITPASFQMPFPDYRNVIMGWMVTSRAMDKHAPDFAFRRVKHYPLV